jgi:hypothetical protein
VVGAQPRGREAQSEMHPADEPGESRDVSEGAVHKIMCPRCKADSSRPEDLFVGHAAAVVGAVGLCAAGDGVSDCGLFRDVAIWCGASERRIGEERPRLILREGRALPVIHIYLPTELAAVLAC